MILSNTTSLALLEVPSQPYASARGERRLRCITGWLLVSSLLVGELGAPWDGVWHGAVGRDWFWTPPHILIYSAVASGGLVALLMVLLETRRYYRRCPGVDERSTVRVWRVFHAPLGYLVTGFGGLATLIAAPFDNYWHELYGIDLTLWSPFHIMGTTGSFIGMLGVIYVMASEAPGRAFAAQVTRVNTGLYTLDVEMSQDAPQADQPFMILVRPQGSNQRFSGQVVEMPVSGTDAANVYVPLTYQAGDTSVLKGELRFPVRGFWHLVLELDGPRGRGEATIPVVVAAPGAMPIWLAWSIGALPALGLLWWILRQRTYQRALLTRPEEPGTGSRRSTGSLA